MYTIRLFGPFDISTIDRGSLKPPGRKACALLALLASAPDQKRSRAWLRALLWPNAAPKPANASLRQELYALKKHFGEKMPLLDYDTQDAWLCPGRFILQPQGPGPGAEEFLEGMDISAEPFEEWLRSERARRLSDLSVPAQLPPPLPRQALRILLRRPDPAPIPRPLAAQINFVLDHMTSLAEQLSGAVFIDPQAAPHGRDGAADCQAVLTVELADLGRLTAAKFLLRRAMSGEIIEHLGTRMMPSAGADRLDALHGFAEIAAACFCAALRNEAQNGRLAAPLLMSIFDLFSDSRDRHQSAYRRLRPLAETGASGLELAWCAYAQMAAGAERFESDGASLREEVRRTCARALEQAPYDAIVNSLAGHIEGVFFGTPEEAHSYHATARRLAPQNSLVASFRAAAETSYDGPKTLSGLARPPIASNPNSPLRFIVDCDLQISLAQSGQHQEASRVGERLLRNNGAFLGAKRYLIANYMALGAPEKARACLQDIQAVDPDFTYETIASRDEPLPAPHSDDLIKEALRAAGR